jgi:hypothetical protein
MRRIKKRKRRQREVKEILSTLSIGWVVRNPLGSSRV